MYQLMQLSLWTLVSLVMSIHLIILMVIVSLIVIFTALPQEFAQGSCTAIGKKHHLSHHDEFRGKFLIRVPGSSKSSF